MNVVASYNSIAPQQPKPQPKPQPIPVQPQPYQQPIKTYQSPSQPNQQIYQSPVVSYQPNQSYQAVQAPNSYQPVQAYQTAQSYQQVPTNNYQSNLPVYQSVQPVSQPIVQPVQQPVQISQSSQTRQPAQPLLPAYPVTGSPVVTPRPYPLAPTQPSVIFNDAVNRSPAKSGSINASLIEANPPTDIEHSYETIIKNPEIKAILNVFSDKEGNTFTTGSSMPDDLLEWSQWSDCSFENKAAKCGPGQRTRTEATSKKTETDQVGYR